MVSLFCNNIAFFLSNFENYVDSEHQGLSYNDFVFVTFFHIYFILAKFDLEKSMILKTINYTEKLISAF